MHSQEYLEGYDAYNAGAGWLCNPHDPGTAAHSEWLSGWHFAEADSAVEEVPGMPSTSEGGW